jgi:hypothetical protein
MRDTISPTLKRTLTPFQPLQMSDRPIKEKQSFLLWPMNLMRLNISLSQLVCCHVVLGRIQEYTSCRYQVSWFNCVSCREWLVFKLKGTNYGVTMKFELMFGPQSNNRMEWWTLLPPPTSITCMLHCVTLHRNAIYLLFYFVKRAQCQKLRGSKSRETAGTISVSSCFSWFWQARSVFGSTGSGYGVQFAVRSWNIFLSQLTVVGRFPNNFCNEGYS